MTTWNEVRQEILEKKDSAGRNDFDGVRRAKIKAVADHTGRPLVIYATDFLNQQKVQACAGDVIVDFEDKLGFYEVTKNIQGNAVDILLHSPGGRAEAVESIVKQLRSKFTDIRFIVPSIAKSAATMLALSGNKIVVDENSELGPIDPQFNLRRPDGTSIVAPAQAIIDQFEAAEKMLASKPENLPAWIPILPVYGPSLYQESKNAIKLSKHLVRDWLTKYMFSHLSRHKALGRARKIANFLGNHRNFLTHARRVDIETLKKLSVEIVDMRTDTALQDAVHALYYAIVITFEGTAAFKLLENSRNDAYIKLVQVQEMRLMAARQPQQQAPSPPPSQE